MTPEHIGVGEDGDLVEVHDPGSQGYVIEKIFAIVAIDEEGGEGIMARRTDMGWMPLISSNQEGIETFIEIAQKMIDIAPGSRAQVIEFGSRRVIKEIGT